MNASVLFVDQTAKLGGAELCLRDIVLERNNPGDRVFLFEEGPFADLLRKAGVAVSTSRLDGEGLVIRRSSGILRKLLSSRTVAKLVGSVVSAAKGNDVIYANTPKATIVASIAGRLAGKPVIYHLHDILSADHFSRSNRALLVYCGKHFASHTIANSHSSAEAFVRLGGRPEKTTVIYNGFEPDAFEEACNSSNEHREHIRSSLGLANETVVALFGRFAPWKGQHVALEALRRLPGLHLLLVGDALFGETEYADSLRETAASPDLAGRVHMMGFRHDVAAIMQAADIVIHCSTSPEPFGRVIVEAMLSRRPVVATRGGGASEIIRHGDTGLIVDPESPENLASAISTLLGGELDLTTMVALADREARSRFNLQDRVAEINAVVETLAPIQHDSVTPAR